MRASPPSQEGGTEGGTETTPLLTGPSKPDSLISRDEERSEHDSHDEEDTPLPKIQIFLLCMARLMDPINFFGIFPFVSFMIQDITGLPETEIGFYSGLVESLFSVTQALVMILWGRLSDRYGRKPGLIVSMAGMALATTLFGLSKSIWQMIMYRCFSGAFAGSIVTVRTMVSENSTKRTQAQAFGYFALATNLGTFIGPLIGGVFNDPVHQYPSIFKGNKLFEENPYFLATFAIGSFGLITTVICGLFLNETLKVKTEENGANSSMSLWEIMRYPGVAWVVFIFSHIALLAQTYTAVVPLFWFTSVTSGGFGFSPRILSIFMALGGLGQALWMVFAFAFLQRRFGNGAVLRGCCFLFPVFFAIWPFCNFLLRRGWEQVPWTLAIFNNLFGMGVCMAFTGSQLTVNDISPSPNTLGMLNAICLTSGTVLRIVSPGAITSIYAFGVEHQILWGYLAWFVNIALGLSLAFWILWLPAKAEGRPKAKQVQDDDN